MYKRRALNGAPTEVSGLFHVSVIVRSWRWLTRRFVGLPGAKRQTEKNSDLTMCWLFSEHQRANCNTKAWFARTQLGQAQNSRTKRERKKHKTTQTASANAKDSVNRKHKTQV